jgi:imidazolonepropionase-like amidohydrolase
MKVTRQPVAVTCVMFLVMLQVFAINSVAGPGIALTHVSLIELDSGRIRNDQTVMVAGERIARVGKASNIALPPGTVVIDATNKFVIPGLWDMHVHGTAIPYFSQLYIANGVTGVRDMFTPMDRIAAERKAIRDGKPGPRIVAAGRIVDGPKPYWPGSVSAKDADEGRQAVATVKEEGSDFVKVYSLLPRDAFFAIAKEAKRQGLAFAGHVPETVSAAEASDAGQRSIEHMTGVLTGCSSSETELLHPDQSIPRVQRIASQIAVQLETYDDRKAHALFARFKRNHTWQCPTLTVLHNIACLNDGSLVGDARLRYLPPEAVGFWDPKRDMRFTNAPASFWTNMQKAERKCQVLVKEMRRAGVEFLAGTDVLNPYCFPGFSLHDELARLVDAGLTPLEALQAATLNPACYLQRKRDLGSVKAGRLADLLVLDANPLEDIHNTRKIRAVFANGLYYDREALDKLLSNAESAAKSQAKVEEPP